ncbi:hypothetical protein KCP77_22585 [Salmonella enterica subsp. enterica]|nr:hypothetical protein KCP77_22585 [Salmonella enterica subsp. enterica]
MTRQTESELSDKWTTPTISYVLCARCAAQYAMTPTSVPRFAVIGFLQNLLNAGDEGAPKIFRHSFEIKHNIFRVSAGRGWQSLPKHDLRTSARMSLYTRRSARR